MFKKFMDNLSNSLGLTSNKISELVKESNRYISAEENVTKDISKTVTALKSYADTETPSLGEAISSLATTFEVIESERKEKVKKLREQYIAPLNELITQLKTLQTEQEESAKAAKEVEKAEKSLTKAQGKAKEKLKPGEIENAETALKAAKQKAEKEEGDVKTATEEFNKAKLEKMQSILQSMVEIEKTYHEKILTAISGVKQKADAINIEEESKVT
ncbi:MAG: BAR domain-containing protein [Promethearchaeota archaeon]